VSVRKENTLLRDALYDWHLVVFFAVVGLKSSIVCLVTLKIGKKIPKKSTGCQIFFLIIFILRTYYYIL
jgi:hypothetical protein